jgi:hypothetical protein
LIDLVLNNRDSTITILYGIKGGGFKPEVNYRASCVVASMNFSDFNSDGLLDIVAAGFSEIGMSILFQSPNGTFIDKAIIRTKYNNISDIKSKDINADNIDDLIIANSASFEIYLGKSNGTFIRDTIYQVSNSTDANLSPRKILLEHLDNDNYIDLVCMMGAKLMILKGKGNARFEPSYESHWANYNSNINTADFDNDGDKDIFLNRVSNFNDQCGILLKNNGPGNFQINQVNVATQDPCNSLKGADMNNDGFVDLVSVQYKSLRIKYGDASGNFKTGLLIEYPDLIQVGNFEIKDLNSDGFKDLVFSNGQSVGVILAKGLSEYEGTYLSFPANNSSELNLVDINNDGIDDLILNGHPFQIYYGDNINIFNLNTFFITDPSIELYNYYSSLVVKDFNRDGRVDIAKIISENEYIIYYNFTNSIPVMTGINNKAFNSVSTKNRKTKILFYPNPTKENSSIHIDHLAEVKSVRIYNSFGCLIKLILEPTIDISLAGITSGVYFINFDLEGEYVTNSLIVE